MTTQYCTRDGRTVDASEALDAQGKLRNGYGLRVPLTMQDSIQRDIARSSQHKPAATTFSDGRGIAFTDTRIADAERALEHIRDQDQRNRAAWLAGRSAAQEARDEMIRDVSTAWKVDPTPTGAGVREPVGARVGDVCMTDDTHAPGHLEMRNGALVCVADKRRDAAQDGADPRAAAYAEMVRDTDYRTRTNG